MSEKLIQIAKINDLLKNKKIRKIQSILFYDSKIPALLIALDDNSYLVIEACFNRFFVHPQEPSSYLKAHYFTSNPFSKEEIDLKFDLRETIGIENFFENKV